MKQLNNNRKSNKSIFLWIIVILVILGFVWYGTSSTQSSQTAHPLFPTVSRQVKEHQIKSMTIRPSNGIYEITGHYKLTTKQKYDVLHNRPVKTEFTTHLLPTDDFVQNFAKEANKNHVALNTKPMKGNSMWSSFLVNLLPTLVFIGFFWWMLRSMHRGGGMRKMLHSNFKPIDPSKDHVRFKDVAGEDAEKQELVEVVNFLKNPKKYSRLGAKIPHGVLLEGPPGTGKTLLAKAVAGEAHVPFYATNGADFVQMFVGVGASRIRELFKKAKKHAPAIIFIDELDALGRKRSNSMGGGANEQAMTLNQLLVEMDGFASDEGVIVIGATNLANVLDPALLRPGRFDRKVLVGRPDVRGRYAILKVHKKNKPFANNIDFKELARQTPGFTGADLANVLNEAALLAARFNHPKILQKDVDEAEDRVIAGPAKKNAVVSQKDRHIVADHEAGHTVVGLVLNHARKVHKVTIVPRGRAGGYTIMLPRGDQKLLSKQDAMEQLAGLMGGRAAEEMCFKGAKSSGASSDFSQATKLARVMVTQYGMSDELGDVALEAMGQNPNGSHAYSEATATKIDDTIRKFLNHAHQQACDVLSHHKKQHQIIANALLKYETLNAKEIQSLFTTGHMPKGDPKLTDISNN